MHVLKSILDLRSSVLDQCSSSVVVNLWNAISFRGDDIAKSWDTCNEANEHMD